MTRRMVTLFDVAAHAGVSHQTVSRVVNDKPGVAEATRDLVWSIVRELGYQPNETARQLVSNRSKTIGLIAYATEHSVPATTLVMIDQTARENGYRVILASLSSLDLETISTAVHDLRAHGVAGLVFNVSIALDLAVLRRHLLGLPAVFMDMAGSQSCTTIMSEHAEGMRAMALHLIRLGHRHVAYIAGPDGWSASQQRYAGWQAAMRESGLSSDLMVKTDWTARSGYEAMQRLLEQRSERYFSGILASNDDLALGAIKAAKEAGLSVPDDLSICGFENMSMSAFTDPPIDTVRLNFRSVIEKGFSLLLGQIHKPNADGHHVEVPVELIIRGSSGRCRTPPSV
ncbi:LacI family DNA-binding transcriptional regulator [Consotaella salsifontis]|uniref:Transcriptional regulator, LacI family n=1 Tax=Consotaella salsifontis TaxID=1365950 RepID=A0A1T4S318_9HYPH|nr:LacI family DNA-binding transcriptional regulator [Consotaella salsifontis]SKA22623.1 transcriptional regulator, LacI family [Consotaella salsifontis]